MFLYQTFSRPSTYGQMLFGEWKYAVSGQQCGCQPGSWVKHFCCKNRIEQVQSQP